MRDLAEILEHWHRGRPIAAIGRSLGVDRKTIRKYAALAAGAGFVARRGAGAAGGLGGLAGRRRTPTCGRAAGGGPPSRSWRGAGRRSWRCWRT